MSTFALHHLTKPTKSILLLLTGSDFLPSVPWTITVHYFPPRKFEGRTCINQRLNIRRRTHIDSALRLFLIYPEQTHGLLAFPCLLVYLCLWFHIGRNRLQRGEGWGSIFHLALPHELSMGPFRKDLHSTDWNIISCWTSTLGLLRYAPCNSFTATPSCLLVTQRPLVQCTYGISLHQDEGYKGYPCTQRFLQYGTVTEEDTGQVCHCDSRSVSKIN